MLQAGRIVNVHLPKDRVTQTHQGYGFVEFISEDDAEYAAKIMNQVRLYGKPIRVNKASADKQKTVDVGAELFVGNLDSLVDEKTLYDTFSRFGTLVVPPKVCLALYNSACKHYLTQSHRLLAMTQTYRKAMASSPSPTSNLPTKPSQTCMGNSLQTRRSQCNTHTRKTAKASDTAMQQNVYWHRKHASTMLKYLRNKACKVSSTLIKYHSAARCKHLKHPWLLA